MIEPQDVAELVERDPLEVLEGHAVPPTEIAFVGVPLQGLVEADCERFRNRFHSSIAFSAAQPSPRSH